MRRPSGEGGRVGTRWRRSSAWCMNDVAHHNSGAVDACRGRRGGRCPVGCPCSTAAATVYCTCTGRLARVAVRCSASGRLAADWRPTTRLGGASSDAYEPYLYDPERSG
eukprot:3628880-Prymnesium_polylepis.1